MEKVIIRFKKMFPPYGAGEIAGFSPRKAAVYLENDIAELYHVPEIGNGNVKVTEQVQVDVKRRGRKKKVDEAPAVAPDDDDGN